MRKQCWFGVKKNIQINNEPAVIMKSNGTLTRTTTPTPEQPIPMARFSIGEEDDDVPLTFKRQRLSTSASASVNRSHSQPQVVTDEIDEQQENIEIEDVESDSEGYEELEPDDEEEEDDDEVETDEDEEEVEVLVPEGCDQQQMTSSSAAVLLRGVASGVVANRSGSPVVSDVNGELKAVLTDPDVLDCPICLDPLSTPVFQCENGHIACSLCCSKVKRKCPSCCMPIGYNRCRAIEKVIESVKVSCKNAQHGCKTTITYSQKTEHEQMCPFVTCYCPHPSCPFGGTSRNMYIHFGIQHAVSTTRFTYDTTFFVHVATQQKHIFFQEQHESVIFILNHEVKEHGRALSVDCVGPSTLKSCFEYQITARQLKSVLTLQCVPDVYTRWSEHPLKRNYLTVPSDFFCCSGTLPLHLCIKKTVLPE
ncbi:putative transcription factor C2H2 family [Helianthus annuus]|uniref:RING-type E3 ubiquitin transferase n=2 Tax=Helianthus annuus TaxID=4232 RepID=A0A251T8J6_HELAN|nr:putative transcription factor C2H2 family [Helianthus annuus]